ncbi:CBS domain-containing protein [Meinhardsimonia xiamenensis]|jgi:CBS domain-containing protein|uniref:CBS domain-containing protein n=1 Tax=Meinhardsimonia xiamenensis TaxID=990712 RepID=A0A1G9CQH2_9RHOB|nr:CBS domain-containing protein [Meinhardsimonia xiamenensis]PRX38280.1 CBS domain protein [Meinhardsimonia xiamenensis]SDK53912.1 CBS domain-containing protein [Meinhardsimonia xiamenensis]
MLVKQILKAKGDQSVATIRPDAPVSEAARILSEKRIGALVVSSDGERPEGIISERDIVRELGRSGDACLRTTVDTIMTREPVTCTADQKADEILSRMTEGRFRHMPVVEGDRMIGLISIGDVVKARLDELSMEKEALTGMIMGH